MTAIIIGLNRDYDIEEGRPRWKTRLIGVGLTIALALFTVIVSAVVVGGSGSRATKFDSLRRNGAVSGG